MTAAWAPCPRRDFRRENQRGEGWDGSIPVAPNRPYGWCFHPPAHQDFAYHGPHQEVAFRAGQPHELQGESRVGRMWGASVAASPKTTGAGTPASSSVRSSHYWFTKLHGGGVAVWKHLPVAAHHDRTAQGQGSLLLATGVSRLDYGRLPNSNCL